MTGATPLFAGIGILAIVDRLPHHFGVVATLGGWRPSGPIRPKSCTSLRRWTANIANTLLRHFLAARAAGRRIRRGSMLTFGFSRTIAACSPARRSGINSASLWESLSLRPPPGVIWLWRRRRGADLRRSLHGHRGERCFATL